MQASRRIAIIHSRDTRDVDGRQSAMIGRVREHACRFVLSQIVTELLRPCHETAAAAAAASRRQSPPSSRPSR